MFKEILLVSRNGAAQRRRGSLRKDSWRVSKHSRKFWQSQWSRAEAARRFAERQWRERPLAGPRCRGNQIAKVPSEWPTIERAGIAAPVEDGAVLCGRSLPNKCARVPLPDGSLGAHREVHIRLRVAEGIHRV